MTDLILAYVTCADEAQAGAIADALVRERLAACVNVLPGMRSTFRWEGAIETAAEVALIAKTRASLLDPLSARVRSLHSYSLPCIVAVPLTGGEPGYLRWLAEESGPR